MIWNLVDSVPALDIPTTLNWKPELKVTTIPGGMIVLLYKLMVVVPFLQLFAIALARLFGRASEPQDT